MGSEEPVEQRELCGVVAVWLLEGDRVTVGQADAEGVRLQAAVPVAEPLDGPAALVELRRADVWEQRAVVGERRDADGKVVLARARGGLPPRPALAVQVA